jgi:hypothetical protein
MRTFPVSHTVTHPSQPSRNSIILVIENIRFYVISLRDEVYEHVVIHSFPHQFTQYIEMARSFTSTASAPRNPRNAPCAPVSSCFPPSHPSSTFLPGVASQQLLLRWLKTRELENVDPRSLASHLCCVWYRTLVRCIHWSIASLDC